MRIGGGIENRLCRGGFPHRRTGGCDIRHIPVSLSYSSLLIVETEEQICRRYEAALAAIAAVDRRYYVNPSPSLADRADYAARQTQLENTRSMLYA